MKFLSYLLSPIFALLFLMILLIFHPIQWIALKISQNTHQQVVDIMNWFLVKSLLVLGVPVYFKNNYELPEGQTMIFVSNHQSMFDIPPLIWHLRKYYPKFVSKAELGKGIPSVSFNLRHGGAALIDRKDGKKAIMVLAEFAKRIHANKWSAVIFPEGTRSRNGQPKKFALNGLKIIAKYNPEALVVPITINNSWKVFRYGKFPLGIGAPIHIEVHKPIAVQSMPINELLIKVETIIKSKIV